MAIFLCGFMGCGKTTIGEILSQRLEMPFEDTDAYIVDVEAMSIPDIFAQKGEPYFRQQETEAVRHFAPTAAVVACGGGLVLKPENVQIGRACGGTFVWLDVPFDVCYERISGDTNRPIVQRNTKEQLRDIYEGRLAAYRAAADVTVSGADTPEETVERLLKMLQENTAE